MINGSVQKERKLIPGFHAQRLRAVAHAAADVAAEVFRGEVRHGSVLEP